MFQARPTHERASSIHDVTFCTSFHFFSPPVGISVFTSHSYSLAFPLSFFYVFSFPSTTQCFASACSTASLCLSQLFDLHVPSDLLFLPHCLSIFLSLTTSCTLFPWKPPLTAVTLVSHPLINSSVMSFTPAFSLWRGESFYIALIENSCGS